MIESRTYRYLSKRDKRSLLALCRKLGVPLLPVGNAKETRALLRDGHQFFNDEPCGVVHKGKLAFWSGCRVIDIIHEIGHALFLGAPLYKSIPDGVADFGDVRWGGDEEGPVMFLSMEITHCLKDYGGPKVLLKEMDKFGYGFGNKWDWTATADKWFNKWRYLQEPKQARKCKVYNTLRISIDFENITAASVAA